MPILIDGDNLLGGWPGRRRSDADRRRLVREVSALARRIRRHIVLVYDGPALPGLGPRADVRFPEPGRSADDVILARLREEPDPRGWTVVTNDRSLADRCRWLGARVESSHRFRERLADDAPEEAPGETGDLDYWLDVFGARGEGNGD